jgi:hypothetical protein
MKKSTLFAVILCTFGIFILNAQTPQLVPISSVTNVNPTNGITIGNGNSVYYTFNSVSQMNDLWATNGTNTYQISDNSSNLTLVNGQAYFFKSYSIGANNYIDLLKTDGNTTGQSYIKTLQVTNNQLPKYPVVFKNKFYFILNNQMWVSDGTTTGTNVLNANLGNLQLDAITTNGDFIYLGFIKLIFNNPYNPTHAGLIYKTNETGVLSLHRDLGFLCVNTGFFIWLRNIENQLIWELAVCSSPIAPIYRNRLGGTNFVSDEGDIPETPQIINGKLFFIKNRNLYYSTATQTTEVTQNYHALSLQKLGQSLIFTNATGPNIPASMLYKSDGTAQGTTLLKTFDQIQNYSSLSNFIKKDENTLYFTAFENGKFAWWKTDGTVEGTKKFADFTTNMPIPNFTKPWIDGNTLYYSANDGVSGDRLWKLDITPIIPPSTTCPNNLLTNPDFEAQNISGWAGSGIYAENQTNGRYISVCTNGAAANQLKTATAGKTYNFSVKTFKSFADTKGIIGFKFLNSSFIPLLQEYQGLTTTTYTTISISKTAPAGTAYVEVSLVKDIGAGCVNADDWCLTEGTVQPPANTCVGNLLTNPSFEAQNISNWYGSGIYVENQANGRYISVCTNGTAANQTQTATAGKTYNLSVKAFKSFADTKGVIGLKFLSSSYLPLLSEYMGVTTTNYSTMNISKTAPAGTAYIEVSLVKVEGSGCLNADDWCLTTAADCFKLIGNGSNKCANIQPNGNIEITYDSTNILKTVITNPSGAPISTQNIGTVTNTSFWFKFNIYSDKVEKYDNNNVLIYQKSLPPSIKNTYFVSENFNALEFNGGFILFLNKEELLNFQKDSAFLVRTDADFNPLQSKFIQICNPGLSSVYPIVIDQNNFAFTFNDNLGTSISPISSSSFLVCNSDLQFIYNDGFGTNGFSRVFASIKKSGCQDFEVSANSFSNCPFGTCNGTEVFFGSLINNIFKISRRIYYRNDGITESRRWEIATEDGGKLNASYESVFNPILNRSETSLVVTKTINGVFIYTKRFVIPSNFAVSDIVENQNGLFFISNASGKITLWSENCLTIANNPNTGADLELSISSNISNIP